MSDYRLLFTDMDGTLLNSRSELSERSIKAVALALKQQGKQVILCSGRSWMSLEHFEKPLGLNTPGHYGVAFNGGYVYETDTKKVLYIRMISNALGLELTRAIKDCGMDPIMYSGQTIIADRITPQLKSYAKQARLTPAFVADFSQVKGEVLKIIIKGANDKLKEVARQLTPIFAGRCGIYFSSEDLLEFSHPEVDKGHALKFLSAHLKVPLEQVIAIGDEANDIGMIKAAGLGIAMANATAEAKAAADIILEENCDQDAAAQVIEQYLL